MQSARGLLLQFDASTELMRKKLVEAAAFTDQWAENTQRRAAQAEAALAGAGNGADLASKGFSFLKGAAAGAIATLTVDSILSAGRAVLNFADDLGTAADQAGIGVERFQTLREALRSLEVDAAQQDKVFQRLLTTLGDVQSGTAGQGVIDVLDRMGITARIANGEIDSTDELLDGIAAAAGRYTTEAKYAADVSALVGQKLGPALAAALKDGGVALHNAETAFRNTGAVIDTEMVAKLADANEAIDSFTERSRNQFVIWSAGLLGIFERLGVAMDNITGHVDTSTRSGLITKGMRLREEISDLKAGKGNFGIPALGEAARKEAELADVDRKLLAQEVKNPALTDPMTRLFPMDGNWFARPAPAAGGGGGGGTGGGRSGAAKKTAPSWLSQARAGDFDTPMPEQDLTIFAELPVAQVSLDEMQATLEAMQALPPIKPVDEEGLWLLQSAAADVSASIAQAVVEGGNLGDALVGSAKRFLMTLAENAIFNLLFGGLLGGTFLGGIFGGRRSSGGPVEPGVPYLVGENSPEIFIPTTRGRIAPTHGNAGGGGGAGGGEPDRLIVDVRAAEAFDVRVQRVASNSGAAAAVNTIGRAVRPTLPSSRAS